MLLYLYTFCFCFWSIVLQYITFGLNTFGAWLSVSVYALESGDAVWRVEHRICKNKNRKHACMVRVQAFRSPWSRRRCPAESAVCATEGSQ